MNNNNTNTITFYSTTHGTFRVTGAHLDFTYQAHSGWTRDSLINKVQGLVGEFDYTDLTYAEAMILISYLTGGIAD